jgi:G3E family GTPase
VLVNVLGAEYGRSTHLGVRQGIVNLANGCICCTIRDDLLEVVLKLVRRQDAPEYMVIRLAAYQSFAIIQTTLPELSALIRLDGVITIVDAEQFGQLTGEYAALAPAGRRRGHCRRRSDLVSVEQLTPRAQLTLSIASFQTIMVNCP